MLDRIKISPAQFAVSITCFIQASSILTSFFVPISRQDSWIVAIMGFILFLPLYFVMFSLLKRFPGKTLMQINDVVFGKIVGKAVSVCYIFFFLTLSSLNLRDLGDFVQKTIMPNTPIWALVIPFILLCAWAVRHGIDVITRYNALFAVVSITIALFASAFVMNIMRFENFFPMFDQPVKIYVQSSHIVATIPYGELILFMMVAPNVKAPPNKMPKYMLIGVFLGFLNTIIVIMRDTAVLGNTITLFGMPPFETLRLINVGHALSRVEILYATVLILFLFSKISLLLYVTALSCAHLIGLKNFKSLVLSLAVVICVYSLTVYSSVLDHAKSGSSIVPVLWTFFEYILPITTLIVAAIRGMKPKKESAVPQDHSAECQPAPLKGGALQEDSAT